MAEISADRHSTIESVIASANAWGKEYRAAVAAGDTVKIAGSAVVFLSELGMAIPNLDENNDAHVLIFAMVTALTESQHGKHSHPLLQAAPSSQRVAGLSQRGLYNEYLGGIAAGATVFLERHGWKPDPAASFISNALKHHGAQRCGLSAVKNWRNEESLLSEPRSESRRFVGIITQPTADRAEREFSESGSNDPGPWVKRWLGEQLKALSSLLGL